MGPGPTEFAIAIVLVLGGLFFARNQWLVWLFRAALGAIAVLFVGLLTLALPGAIILEALVALGLVREFPPGGGEWALAIQITYVGAAMVLPLSLALRYMRPDIVGWGHALATALLTLAGTVLFAFLYLVRTYWTGGAVS